MREKSFTAPPCQSDNGSLAVAQSLTAFELRGDLRASFAGFAGLHAEIKLVP